MNTWIIITLILLVIIIVLIYNSLIHRRNQVENAYSSVDVMLKKRADLIPNLVSAVKGYMTHEKNILEKITQLRTDVLKQTQNIATRFENENILSEMLKSVFAVVENYPELKANENVLQLQASLNEAEEQISAARRAYNAAVAEYNNAVQMFPSNIIAGLFRFKAHNMFEAPAEEKERPSASLKS